MLGIGVGAAGILAVAARLFYVEVDPRITEIEDALPGANCGGCGYSGCSACAEAIVAGKAAADACIAGGAQVTGDVARIMGAEAGSSEPRLSRHRCTGGDRAERKYEYDGALDCRAMAQLYGGDLECNHGCLGLATCVSVCPFDALRMTEEGYPEVIPDRCTGCGNCERACPTGVIAVRKASEQLLYFHQEDECIAPCSQLCPAQIDIPRYIDKAAQGLYLEALEVVKERNPLPSICGRVCPAPCEAGCRRQNLGDAPVHHNYIKRYLADRARDTQTVSPPSCLPDTGKKVALVGGGPAGLTAAHFLRRLGHSPTILDSKPELGGMLRYGIPEYRLPKKVLDEEIQEILDLGVEVRTDVALGVDFTVEDLEREFDAIFLAMGAWDNASLRCEGEELDGVWKGTEFLQKRELGIPVDLKGRRVVVVGGGNTAMDAARSALRMGAEWVKLLYRRTRAEMPANEVEIEAAEHEGIEYHFLAAPTRLLGDEHGKLERLEFLRMELGEPDSSGRRRPVPIEGSESSIEVDVVIAAIGQKPRADWYSQDLAARGLELTRWNSIEADPATLQSGIPHIFTGGDIFTGPALLIDAVGAGRRAARSIHLFLSGQELTPPPGHYVQPTRVNRSAQVKVAGVASQERVAQPELPVESRIRTFEEVDLLVSAEQLQAEAQRCMRCGTLCYFPDALRERHERGKTVAQRAFELVQISPRPRG
jgi:NADPH-dependent glutamate synthase beta subunit-like oxidoreductase